MLIADKTMVRHNRQDVVILRIKYNEIVDRSPYKTTTKVAEIIKRLKQRYGLKGVFRLYGTMDTKITKDVMYVLQDIDKLFFQALKDTGKTVFNEDEIRGLIDKLESEFTYETWGGKKKLELDPSELFWWLDENEGNFTLPKVHQQNGVAFIKRGTHDETATRLTKIHMDVSAETLASKYKGLSLRDLKKSEKSMQETPKFWQENQHFNSRIGEEAPLPSTASFSYTDHTK